MLRDYRNKERMEENNQQHFLVSSEYSELKITTLIHTNTVVVAVVVSSS